VLGRVNDAYRAAKMTSACTRDVQNMLCRGDAGMRGDGGGLGGPWLVFTIRRDAQNGVGSWIALRDIKGWEVKSPAKQMRPCR
jgi:hypothetical protein